MFIDDLFKQFEAEGLRYLLVGGMALNLHGLARLTHDIDLMLDLEAENIVGFLSLIEDLGYETQADLANEDLYSAEKRGVIRLAQGGLAFSFYNKASGKQNIDILLENPIDFKTAFDRRHTEILRGASICVASAEDLIFMKMQTKGRAYEEDIGELRSLTKSNQ